MPMHLIQNSRLEVRFVSKTAESSPAQIWKIVYYLSPSAQSAMPLAAAIVAGAQRGDIAEAMIVIDSEVEASPCGACRQVMAEFMDMICPITVYNLRDRTHYTSNLKELLPKAFTPEALEID